MCNQQRWSWPVQVAASRPSAAEKLLCSAIAGRVPAEALSRREREELLRSLVDAGLTDLEIAAQTRWSLYTVARLRASLGLPRNYDPNRSPAA